MLIEKHTQEKQPKRQPDVQFFLNDAQKRLCLASLLCLIFMLAELLAGFYAHSLAVLTDAAHMLSDFCSFAISLFAIYAANLPGTPRLSFGYQRAEILGVLVSISLIWILTFWLVIQAFHRLARPERVKPEIMIVIAIFGIATNLCLVHLLSHDGHHHHHHGHGHKHPQDQMPHDHPNPLSVSLTVDPDSTNFIGTPAQRLHLQHRQNSNGSYDDNKSPTEALDVYVEVQNDAKDSAVSHYKYLTENQKRAILKDLVLNSVKSGKQHHIGADMLDNIETLSISELTEVALVIAEKGITLGICLSQALDVLQLAVTTMAQCNVRNMEGETESHLLRSGLRRYSVDTDNDENTSLAGLTIGLVGRSKEILDESGYRSRSHSNGLEQNSCAKQDDSERGAFNLSAAHIHALGDMIQNIGVLLAGLIIYFKPEWNVADPLCTLGFSIVVIYTTLDILKDATNVLMEGTPAGINPEVLVRELLEIPNVVGIHDVHIWSLSVGHPALACHLVINDASKASKVLDRATALCQSKHHILHTTIQVDFSDRNAACETNAHTKCHADR